MRLHLIISGQVQGVFYRVYTKEKALDLGLAGWVRNLADGRVEAVFEGTKDKIDKMIKWLWKGSPGSKVDKVGIVEKVEKVEKKLRCFEIKY